MEVTLLVLALLIGVVILLSLFYLHRYAERKPEDNLNRQAKKQGYAGFRKTVGTDDLSIDLSHRLACYQYTRDGEKYSRFFRSSDIESYYINEEKRVVPLGAPYAPSDGSDKKYTLQSRYVLHMSLCGGRDSELIVYLRPQEASALSQALTSFCSERTLSDSTAGKN